MPTYNHADKTGTAIERKFFVLGGAGAMGRVTVRDLFASHRRNEILIADYDQGAARTYAASFRSKRVRACFADARKPRTLAGQLKTYPLVINCTQHDFNLSVMEAALGAGAHYLDLGGLFVWTRKQLKLRGRFKRAGLMAILGVGGSPGITNVMARHLAEPMERVSAIKVRSGWADGDAETDDLSFGFSPQTILEELTLPAWIFSQGRFRTVKPRTRWEQVRFGRPVGTVWCLCTRHSEVGTLPDSFRKKGIRYCDFKLGYDRGFVREVMKRVRAGWTLDDFRALIATREHVDDCEILRVVVEGRRADRKGTVRVSCDCISRADPAWRATAGDINTGCPPSIIAQMVVNGSVSLQPGVWGPEQVVPPKPFFRELERRGMRIVTRRG